MSREPSMEEILSSIRRVIARDEAARDVSLEERFGGRAGDVTGSTADDEDVLDLTDVEMPAMTTPAVPAQATAMTAGVADAAEDVPLVSTNSEVAARQAIDQLTAALDHGAAPSGTAPLAAPGMTIEALAEAALRPMLKAWLDENLPGLVERLVAREIARITGGKL